ncbi:MAG: hypothetical protein ACFB0C_15975 [Leptolyngbyaceae cyanobacterium]
MGWFTIGLIGGLVGVTTMGRFVALPKLKSAIAQARFVILLGALSFLLVVLGLVQAHNNYRVSQWLTMSPLTKATEVQEAVEAPYVLIAGRISPNMSANPDGYVTYLRLERDSNDSFGDYEDLDVVLSDGTEVRVGREYGSRPVYRYDYYNWPTQREGFYTFYYLEPNQPVLALGHPRRTNRGITLADTEFVLAGTAEDYGPLFVDKTRPWLPVGRAAMALALAIALIIWVSLLPILIRLQRDESFHWQAILSQVRIG